MKNLTHAGLYEIKNAASAKANIQQKDRWMILQVQGLGVNLMPLMTEVEKWHFNGVCCFQILFRLDCPWYFKSFYADIVCSCSKSKHSLAGQSTVGDWLHAQSLLLTSAKALLFLSSAERGVGGGIAKTFKPGERKTKIKTKSR